MQTDQIYALKKMHYLNVLCFSYIPQVEEAQKRLNNWDEKKEPLLAGFNDNDK